METVKSKSKGWRSSTPMLNFWIDQRAEAWSSYFEALELYDLSTTHQGRRMAGKKKAEASRRAQYFDLLIMAAIDPLFDLWAVRDHIREGVEL